MRVSKKKSLMTTSQLLLLIALGPSIGNSLLTGTTTVVDSAFGGSHPTKIDTFMRETLCSNQAAMCIASCQNNVQTNDCNTETLEWECVCTAGTTNTIHNWQYPIPFSLCRIQLLECIKGCPRINLDSAVPDQQKRFAVQTPLGGDLDGENNGNNDMKQHSDIDDVDQNDYNALQELRTLHQHDRLEKPSYSRFEAEVLREQVAAKKKQLHKHLWATEQRQRQRNKGAESNGEFSRQNTISFTTVVDPTSRHLAECEAHCHSVLSCGTETAPQYHDIQQIVSPGHAS
ncbi:hypothetical protein BGZ47_006371 [Haplosporangium gracile]|nr:hypothetical protein BGZ47_006371 [Haplosporangium gracile]